ncbi:MAG: LamG domain-containing protein [Kineosporiaceae bacterium]
MNAALAQAASTGVAVAVPSLTDEMSTTVAEPTGLLTTTLYAEPHQAEVSPGNWQTVDPQVATSPDGRVRPKVSVSGLSFSGKGSGASLVRVPTPAGDVDLDWPWALPLPVLSDTSVTYPNAFPGVDLVLRSTVDGFTSLLVVKTKKGADSLAAAMPAFTVRGPAQVQKVAAGGVRLVTTAGKVLFEGSDGLMWDSAGDAIPAASGSEASGDAAVADPTVGPSVGDRVGEVVLSAAGSTISMAPDAAMLASYGLVFPLYVDPPLGLHQTGRILVSDFNEASWGWTNYARGEGVGYCANVGYCSKDRPKPFVKRQYFQFAPTNLWGKSVQGATFRAYQTHSVSCSTTTAELRRSAVGISPGSRWASIKDRDAGLLVSKSVGPANGGCGGAGWVDWSGDPLKKLVTDLAEGRMTSLAIYLRARDEPDPARNLAGDANSWHRFRHDASLQVSYLPKAGLPYELGVWSASVASSRVCAPSTGPAVIPTATPKLSALARLAVPPSPSSDQGKLRTRFAVQQRQADGSWPEIWNQTVPVSPGYVSNGVPTSVTVPAGKLVDGGVYRLAANNISYLDTLALADRQAVGCYFQVSTTVLRAPAVTQGTVYSLCEPDEGSCAVSGGVNVLGKIIISPDATDDGTKVKRFKWTVGSSATVYSADYAQAPIAVDVVPAAGGPQLIRVWSEDTSGRPGATRTKLINVTAPAGPTGWWPTQAMTTGIVPDGSGAGVAGYTPHDLVLSGSVVDPRGRRSGSAQAEGKADFGLRFDGVDDYASPGSVFDSGGSFTVAAWVLLKSDTVDAAVMSATSATGTSGWALRYVASRKAFAFGTYTVGSTGGVYVESSSGATTARNVWVHLVGSYDASRRSVRVWIDGKGQAEKLLANTQYPPAGSLPLLLGRVKESANVKAPFGGVMDEMMVWPRLLSDAEVRQRGSLEPGRLDVSYFSRTAVFDPAVLKTVSTGIQIDDSSGAYAADGLNFNAGVAAVPAAEGGAAAVDLNGAGALCQYGPYTPATGSFTISVSVRINSADLGATTRAVGSRIVLASQQQVLNGDSAWSLGAVKISTSEWRWFFARSFPGSSGERVEVLAQSDAVVSGDRRTKVSGVFSSLDNTIRVGVDGEPDGQAEVVGSWNQATGVFCIGRELKPDPVSGTGPQTWSWRGYFIGRLYKVVITAGALQRDQLKAEVSGL